MTKDLEQLREENKQLSQAHDKEIAAREGAEQKLAQVKSDLAKAQSEIEDKQYYIVVHILCMYVCIIVPGWIHGKGSQHYCYFILSQYFRSTSECSNYNLTALIEYLTALLESIDIS